MNPQKTSPNPTPIVTLNPNKTQTQNTNTKHTKKVGPATPLGRSCVSTPAPATAKFVEVPLGKHLFILCVYTKLALKYTGKCVAFYIYLCLYNVHLYATCQTTPSWINLPSDIRLGLQRYICPRYDMYPDTDVTIQYTIRYVMQQQNKKGIGSCLACGLKSLYSWQA